MEKEEDLRFDEWYNFRVVESLGKFYIQREFSVTGYHPDGRYDPCIDTSWNTLSNFKSEYVPYKGQVRTFTGYASCETKRDIIKLWRYADIDGILPSANYIDDRKSVMPLLNPTVVCFRNDLMEEFPEYVL